MSEDALVFSAKDGLGNRLRALIGFRALAKFQQVPMLLHWDKDGACDADFTDLFENTGWEDVRLINADEAAGRKASHPERFYYSSVWFTEVWRQHAQNICAQEDFSRLAVRYLRSLQPRRELQARIDEFAHRHALDQSIGMHIRMTDNVHAYDWWIRNDPDFDPNKISLIEGFEAAIHDLALHEEQVFISTDNREVAAKLGAAFSNLVLYRKNFDEQGYTHHVRAHYGSQGMISRLIGQIKGTLGQRPPNTWRTTDVSDALIEMYLLARCRRVIGTYYSSFSQVAALIGGAPLLRMEGRRMLENTFLSELNAHADGLVSSTEAIPEKV
jgi:hypothetical protein